MIGKALGYLGLSIMVLLLAPAHAFFLGLEWGLERDFSFKALWVAIGKIFFWDNDGNLKAAFKKEITGI